MNTCSTHSLCRTHYTQPLRRLCKAFGFKKHLIVPGENGTIRYAELTLGKAMVMLGSAYSKLTKSPEDLGFQTQSPYLIVDDPDVLYTNAKQNGARMDR